jgi:hypothetical protein
MTALGRPAPRDPGAGRDLFFCKTARGYLSPSPTQHFVTSRGSTQRPPVSLMSDPCLNFAESGICQLYSQVVIDRSRSQ